MLDSSVPDSPCGQSVSEEIPKKLSEDEKDFPQRKRFALIALVFFGVVFVVSTIGYYAGSSEAPSRQSADLLHNLDPLPNIVIISMLQNPPEEVRALRLVIAEASRRHDFSVSRELAKLDSHPDPTVRIQVAKALASAFHIASQPAIKTMSGLLRDQDYLVRGYAAKMLGRMGTDAARDALRSQLAQEHNDVVKTVIKRSLGDPTSEV